LGATYVGYENERIVFKRANNDVREEQDRYWVFLNESAWSNDAPKRGEASQPCPAPAAWKGEEEARGFAGRISLVVV
jgi:hypothetical protein